MISSFVAARQTIVLAVRGDRIEASLYNLQRNTRVRGIKIARTGSDIESQARMIVEKLYAGLNRQAPGVSNAVLPIDNRVKKTQRSWWFWPSIGLGVAAAMIIPTVLLLQDDDTLERRSGTGAVIIEF